MDQARTMTLKQAASRLEVSQYTVRNWCRRAVANRPSRLSSVSRDKAGNFKISEVDILRLELGL